MAREGDKVFIQPRTTTDGAPTRETRRFDKLEKSQAGWLAAIAPRTYDRDYWSNYKTPEEGGQAFHAQNGELKSPRARARARERWPRLKAFSKSNCCA